MLLPSKINVLCDRAAKGRLLGLASPSLIRTPPDLTNPHLQGRESHITTFITLELLCRQYEPTVAAHVHISRERFCRID